MCIPLTAEHCRVKQKLIELQRKIVESTIIIGSFNTCLSEIIRLIRQKISKDRVELHDTINQLNIEDGAKVGLQLFIWKKYNN